MIPSVASKPFAIFDMDGTLVDSMWGWNDVYVSFFVSHGADCETAKEIVAHTAHFTTYESAELFGNICLSTSLPRISPPRSTPT